MKFDPKTYLAQVGALHLGFDPKGLDGKHGNDTEAAITAFTNSPLNPDRKLSDSVVRTVNAAGLELIKHFEGLYLSAYRCPAGVWTIGYGHTGLTHKDGTVKAGRKITKEQAEELLKHDLRKFADRVQDGCNVPLSDDQFSALVSFDFNTGGFLKSTLRTKLNAGDYKGAADQLLRWDKAGGKVLAGLVRRRKSERNLFLGVKPSIVR
jgi:lysozyme